MAQRTTHKMNGRQTPSLSPTVARGCQLTGFGYDMARSATRGGQATLQIGADDILFFVYPSQDTEQSTILFLRWLGMHFGCESHVGPRTMGGQQGLEMQPTNCGFFFSFSIHTSFSQARGLRRPCRPDMQAVSQICGVAREQGGSHAHAHAT